MKDANAHFPQTDSAKFFDNLRSAFTRSCYSRNCGQVVHTHVPLLCPNSISSSLLKSKPAQNLLKTWSKTWFYAGFEQDRSNGMWTLPSSIIWYWPRGGDALRLGR